MFDPLKKGNLVTPLMIPNLCKDSGIFLGMGIFLAAGFFRWSHSALPRADSNSCEGNFREKFMRL